MNRVVDGDADRDRGNHARRDVEADAEPTHDAEQHGDGDDVGHQGEEADADGQKQNGQDDEQHGDDLQQADHLTARQGVGGAVEENDAAGRFDAHAADEAVGRELLHALDERP